MSTENGIFCGYDELETLVAPFLRSVPEPIFLEIYIDSKDRLLGLEREARRIALVEPDKNIFELDIAVQRAQLKIARDVAAKRGISRIIEDVDNFLFSDLDGLPSEMWSDDSRN